MKSDINEAQAIQFFSALAQLATLNLSVEHYYNQILAKVPDDLWQKIVGNSPTWFDFYFQTPMDAFNQMMKSPSAEEAFKTDGTTTDPLAMFDQISNRAEVIASETVSLAQDILFHDGPMVLIEGEEFSAEFIQELALFKSLSAETRARATYGQGMLALVDAGKRGKDEGYFRAVTIDPTVQWHRALIERASRDAFGGRKSFVTRLQLAADKGPSKKIDKDLNQLRYILSLLHDFKILQKLSKDERYGLFCGQLGLYPDTGEEPKAALLLFIKRWEASLLL